MTGNSKMRSNQTLTARRTDISRILTRRDLIVSMLLSLISASLLAIACSDPPEPEPTVDIAATVAAAVKAARPTPTPPPPDIGATVSAGVQAALEQPSDVVPVEAKLATEANSPADEDETVNDTHDVNESRLTETPSKTEETPSVDRADPVPSVIDDPYDFAFAQQIKMGKSEEFADIFAAAFSAQRALGKNEEYANTYAEQRANGKTTEYAVAYSDQIAIGRSPQYAADYANQIAQGSSDFAATIFVEQTTKGASPTNAQNISEVLDSHHQSIHAFAAITDRLSSIFLRVSQHWQNQNTFRHISVGYQHVCGLRLNGTAHCFGKDLHGATKAPKGAFKAISTGAFHTCGLRPNGEVECWGADQYEITSPPGGRFTQLSATGIVFSKDGEHLYDEPHGITCGIRNNGTVNCWGGQWTFYSTPLEGTFKSIATSSENQVCGISTDNTVQCAYVYSEVRESIGLTGEFKSIAVGLDRLCGIRLNGELVCNRQSISDDGPYLDVSVSAFFVDGKRRYIVCGLTVAQNIKCWGDLLVSNFLYDDISPHYILPSGHATNQVLTQGVYRATSWNDPRFADLPYYDFKSIGIGTYFGCAIRSDEQTVCFHTSDAEDFNAPAGNPFANDAIVKQWFDSLTSGNDTMDSLGKLIDALPETISTDDGMLFASITTVTDGIELLMEATLDKMTVAAELLENIPASSSHRDVPIATIALYESRKFMEAADDVIAVLSNVVNKTSTAEIGRSLDMAVEIFYHAADNLSNEGLDGDPLYTAGDFVLEGANR